MTPGPSRSLSSGLPSTQPRHETTGRTPAELMTGRTLKGPLERLIYQPPLPDQAAYLVIEKQKEMTEEVKHRMGLHRVRQARYYNVRRKDAPFHPGDLVWLRSHPLSSATAKFSAKLVAKWEGPVEIKKKKLGPINYNMVNLKRRTLTSAAIGWGGLCSTATYCSCYIYV